MPRKNNTFLSWSKLDSNAVAYHFSVFLPQIVQNCFPFFSSDSLKRDTDWFSSIKDELINAQTGVVFLTKENLHEQWILFEAGALMSKNSLCVLLCDLTMAELNDSNSIFKSLNATSLESEKEVLRLFETISEKVSPDVHLDVIRKTFKVFYPELLDSIKSSAQKATSIDSGNAFAQFVGTWKLAFRKTGGYEDSEVFELLPDGRYLFKPSRENNFRLKILEHTDTNVVWQKIKLNKDGKEEYVHSVENLVIKANNLTHMTGTDTLGYVLNYVKVE